MKGSPFQVGTVLGEASEGVKKTNYRYHMEPDEVQRGIDRSAICKGKKPKVAEKIFEVIMTENIPHLIKTFIYKTK